MAWLHQQRARTLPKSLLGQAITYSLNQWEKLTAFLKDGRLEIDNNRSERSIKPFVIGRKNWLFANTPRGAKASAMIYSMIETAKENGLNPFKYLKYLFEQLPQLPDPKDPEALDQLLALVVIVTADLPRVSIINSYHSPHLDDRWGLFDAYIHSTNPLERLNGDPPTF